MKLKTIVFVIALMALLIACAPAPTPSPTAAPPIAAPKPTEAAKPAEKMSFSLVTGGTGGVWYPLGGAISGVVGKNVANTAITVEATTAATDNLKLLTANKAGMAFAYDYHAGWLNDGKMPGVTGKFNARILMAFYEQPLHVVTKDGTGIKTLDDLKGKRVSTGAPNSGTEEQAGYVLKALGMDWDKDIKREKLGAAECVAGLKDGKLDAFFWSGAVPTASIIDLANTPGLKMVLLPISGDLADKIMKANPGVFHPSAFKKASYNGVDADVPSLAITAVIQVMDTFPEDRVYQILTALFANMKDLSVVAKEVTDLTPAASMAQLGADARKWLHPGAQKFFSDKGALK